jgi:hypothetical protein
MKPCVHHTFTHAKALAVVRDHKGLARKIRRSAPLPRAVADGVRHYPEIVTWLAARGPWRATITATDWFPRNDVRQPTGGCISMLWHQQLGPLLAGSMPRYVPAERRNMQDHPHPGDHPLTPRIELRQGEKWFTQLYDLTAEVKHRDADGRITFEVATRLLDESGEAPSQGRAGCSLTYLLDNEATTINASAPGVGIDAARPRLVLPIISPGGEKVTQVSAERIEIRKPDGTLIIEANAPLRIQDTGRARIFNLVPGFEAVPVFAEIPAEDTLTCRIRVKG